MSKFNWLMLAVGLVIATGDVLRRMYSFDSQKTSSAIRLIPAVTFVAPFVIVVFAVLSSFLDPDRHSDDPSVSKALLLLGILASLAASGIGVFALMMLSVSGNIGRDGWRQPAMRRVLIFACLDVVHPILLIALGVIVILLRV